MGEHPGRTRVRVRAAVLCACVLAGCGNPWSGADASSVQMFGGNGGFGVSLPGIADDGSVSVGPMMMCAGPDAAPVTVTSLAFATGEGLVIQQYGLRRNPFEASPGTGESVAGQKGTLDHFGFAGSRVIEQVCGQGSDELGVQLGRDGVDVATGEDLQVAYRTVDGEEGTFTVHVRAVVCGPAVTPERCGSAL